MGGEAGTRLLQRLAMPVSADTVLRLVRGLALPMAEAVSRETFCSKAAQDPGWLGKKPVTAACLDERLAVAETPLEAAEDKIRSRETSLGNWITDQIVTAFKDCRADGAFINAGGLRLNHDIASGSAITMRQLEELIEYPTRLHVYPLSHAKLREAL